MCSRFENTAPSAVLVERFGLAVPPEYRPAPEIRPTEVALAVESGGKALMLRFGIAVDWDDKPLINARAETLDERPTFRPLLGNRCLIPATAYFEWRAAEGGKRRNRIHPPGHVPFAFAGLYKDGAFALITCHAAPSIAQVHERMPVILAPDAEALWLDTTQPFTDILIPHRGALQADEAAALQGDLFGS